MTINHLFTEDELARLEAFSWGTSCERQEMIWVYETILRNAEDEDTKKAVKRLLKVMRRER